MEKAIGEAVIKVVGEVTIVAVSATLCYLFGQIMIDYAVKQHIKGLEELEKRKKALAN